jgi:cell division protein FtsI (penicillin-binding protein 3)
VVAHRAPLYPRLTVVAIALVTVMVVLAGRLTYLGTVTASAMPPDRPSTELPAQRGALWDRRGALLATESYVYRVNIAPNEVNDSRAFAHAVAPVLDLAESDVLVAAADIARPWVPLAVNVSSTAAHALSETRVAGIHLERDAGRTYPLGATAAHVTGFVNAEDKAFYGVEEQYDTVLRGHPGTLHGRYGSDPRAYEPPRDGTGLVLTIDRDLQLAAATALQRAVESQSATGGTIVAIEPSTGAILALTSLPSFDPNDLAGADPAAFVDPAISAIYEPGSVLKAVTIAAALDAGVITPDSTYEDTGKVDVDGLPIENWDRLAHGTTTMTELLQFSLNVGAVHVAQTLGRDRFYAALAAFGLGTPTGVDLAGEIAGLVTWPTADATWTESTLATNSFGQGIAATPLQVISAIAALGNDGRLMHPHVVAAVTTGNGQLTPVAPQLVRQTVSPRAAGEAARMLEAVVSGHVTQAAVPGYSVAGKTGTSQIATPDGYEPHDTIASFAGFLPATEPRVAILVKIDRPDAVRGSEVAAPVFADVARAAVDILGIPPDRPIGSAAGSNR